MTGPSTDAPPKLLPEVLDRWEKDAHAHQHQFSGPMLHLIDVVRELERDLTTAEQRLEAAEKCSTCFGTPHPSGLVCVCDGKNTRDAEVDGLRRAALEAQQQLAAAEQREAGLRDRARQPMQVILSSADNIRTRLRQLGATDADIVESVDAIERAIPRLDAALAGRGAEETKP